MDETDRRILAVLQQNARISMRDLGKMVSLSNTATTERVRRLEEAGVIRGYRAQICQDLLGKHVHVFILLECKNDVRYRPAAFLAFTEQSTLVHSVAAMLSGGIDYLLEVHCQDINELQAFQQELMAFGQSTTYFAEEWM